MDKIGCVGEGAYEDFFFFEGDENPQFSPRPQRVLESKSQKLRGSGKKSPKQQEGYFRDVPTGRTRHPLVLTGAFEKSSMLSAPSLCPNSIQHLAFAFLAGVLLTLLLLALVFFIVKCCRKCHSSPWALDPPLDPHSGHDPPAKLSSPEGALTYAKVTFKISEETNNHLTEKHSANLDPVVYAQVKVTDSPYLSNEA